VAALAVMLLGALRFISRHKRNQLFQNSLPTGKPAPQLQKNTAIDS
jgi:hypothetical protein